MLPFPGQGDAQADQAFQLLLGRQQFLGPLLDLFLEVVGMLGQGLVGPLQILLLLLDGQVALLSRSSNRSLIRTRRLVILSSLV